MNKNLKLMKCLVIKLCKSVLFVPFLFIFLSCDKPKDTGAIGQNTQSHRELLEKLIADGKGYNGYLFSHSELYGKTYSDFLIRYGKPYFVSTQRYLNSDNFVDIQFINESFCCYRGCNYLIDKFHDIENFTLRIAKWDIGVDKYEVLEIVFFFFDKEFYAISVLCENDKTELYE